MKSATTLAVVKHVNLGVAGVARCVYPVKDDQFLSVCTAAKIKHSQTGIWKLLCRFYLGGERAEICEEDRQWNKIKAASAEHEYLSVGGGWCR